MSLVGSLEDLGLTDILQIVSLARKSGRLLLRAGNDAGRIVLCDGLVCAAAVKGEGGDLRSLLVAPGFVSADDFERASEWAGQHDRPLRDAVVRIAGFPLERLESLRREHVERAIMQMFTWHNGEFSFEVRDDVDPEDIELMLPNGINTQYLAMEATRLCDEGVSPDDPSSAHLDLDDMPVFSGESDAEAIGESVGIPSIIDTIALAAARESDEDDADSQAETTGAVVEVLVEEPRAVSEQVVVPVESATPAGPVVVLDTDLTGLEWFKACAAAHVLRVHIFQRGDLAVQRIRQYLVRGVVPLVVASPAVLEQSSDPALLARLRALAPGIRVLALVEEGQRERAPEHYDGCVERPVGLAADPKLWTPHEPLAEALRQALNEFAGAALRPPEPPAPAFRDSLDRLREISDRMRDPSGSHDVLSLVLEYAAAQFGRVAIFMIRDDSAVGMARRGFGGSPSADAPGPEEIELSTRQLPEPFGAALAARRGVCAALGPRVGEVASWLGDTSPQESYVGPIESGGCVAALLYADHLPEQRLIGDTTALEVVLHEAGLALDRAALERALVDAGRV